ncbi:MAG: hypothetical protein KDK90_24045 [Leptospiraceae bacterium]|nr:hypothetical protein [Leptospiraceae bacterium]
MKKDFLITLCILLLTSCGINIGTEKDRCVQSNIYDGTDKDSITCLFGYGLFQDGVIQEIKIAECLISIQANKSCHTTKKEQQPTIYQNASGSYQ